MSRTFIDAVDSNSLRVAAYLVTAALLTWWGIRERRQLDAHRIDLWPTYWFISAVVLAAMGLARSVGVAEVVSEFGREQAQASGWYETRRAIQASAVGVVAVVWLTTISVAVLRVPPRRRRYLPHAITLSAIIAFAAVRLVSLHHIDTLLYRRDLGGVRVVTIIGLSLLLLSIAATSITSIQRPRIPIAPDSKQRISRSQYH